MSSEIHILTLQNERLFELLIKKNFVGKYSLKKLDGEIELKLDYIIRKKLIQEKLKDAEGDSISRIQI